MATSCPSGRSGPTVIRPLRCPGNWPVRVDTLPVPGHNPPCGGPSQQGRTIIIRFIVVALISCLAVVAAACGSSGTTLNVSLSDKTEGTKLTSSFSPNQLAVRAGEEVTFKLSNVGTVPHNMRIAGPDGQYNTGDDTVVGPDLLKPGESATKTWTAPTSAMALVFRCDFHLEGGSIKVQ